MVNINVNFKKKDLWLLSAIVVFLIGVGFVVAYNANFQGGIPSAMGHSSDEIMVKNSAGNLVSLQSLIDSGGLGGFGNYGSTITKTDGSTEVESDEISATQASTDLLVFAVVQPLEGSGWARYGFKGYTSSTSNGNYTLRVGMSSFDNSWAGGTLWGVQSFTMFVKKGEYYKITKQGLYGTPTRTYTTIPIGN